MSQDTIKGKIECKNVVMNESKSRRKKDVIIQKKPMSNGWTMLNMCKTEDDLKNVKSELQNVNVNCQSCLCITCRTYPTQKIDENSSSKQCVYCSRI